MWSHSRRSTLASPGWCRSAHSVVADRGNSFETVRLLSDSPAFDLVMDEHAETVDELGQLARLGTKYRQEVLDKPPAFY